MKAILFVCVANSARSQMAEGLARALAPADLEIYSAGSQPTWLNPLAVEVMKEIGIDISRQAAKGLEIIPVQRIGTVVTLCDGASCPLLPGAARTISWPLADPASATGSRLARRRAFRRTRTILHLRIGRLLDAL
ncbi:MAG: arsenate reductase ArsC [Acidobacteriota bacterium]